MAAAALASGGTAAQGSASKAPLAISAADPKLAWGGCPPIFPGACQIAVLHGDPAQPNSDVFLRIGPGYVLPGHRHTSAERMILVEGELQVRYEGSPARVLKAGNYAFGPAGLPHEGKCLSASPCTLFIAFEGPVDAEPVAPVKG
jgi:quercetin dioxygenase-like cupin family protein